jgi:hypothetical protein
MYVCMYVCMCLKVGWKVDLTGQRCDCRLNWLIKNLKFKICSLCSSLTIASQILVVGRTSTGKRMVSVIVNFKVLLSKTTS